MARSEDRGTRPLIWLRPAAALWSRYSAHAAAPAVSLHHHDGKAELRVNGEPYYIKGAGGDGSKPKLVEAGGNTFRTWGAGDDTQAKLDEAQAAARR